jgi:hypothetical protein
MGSISIFTETGAWMAPLRSGGPDRVLLGGPGARQGVQEGKTGMRTWMTVAMTAELAIALGVLRVGAEDKGGQEVRGLIPKIVQAWETMDIGKVDPHYATDAEFAFFDIAPMKYANWAEYRTSVQKLFFERNRSLKFTVTSDVRVHRRGRLAWATFAFGLT